MAEPTLFEFRSGARSVRTVRVAQPRLFATIEGTPTGWQTGVAFRSKQRARSAIMFLGEDPCGLVAGLPPANMNNWIPAFAG